MVKNNKKVIREQLGNKMSYHANHDISIQEKSFQVTSSRSSLLTKLLLQFIKTIDKNGNKSFSISFKLNEKNVWQNSCKRITIDVFRFVVPLKDLTTIYKKQFILNNISVKKIPEAKPDPPSLNVQIS